MANRSGQTEAQRSLSVLVDRNAKDFDALVLTPIAAATASGYDRALRFLERAQNVRPGNTDVAV